MNKNQKCIIKVISAIICFSGAAFTILSQILKLSDTYMLLSFCACMAGGTVFKIIK